ncbi:response regulators consisting of a CheY-like receiver domain and a winged-helix DNA-binding domain [Clostridium sp. CAG:628]|nr:response regulators consisting of a CheY-like receiver domain and a winged-helix DNA-binding domain [Clostridium sp. CAG:628]
MTILVVDDELLIRKVIREYLESENYKVLEAENGLDALRVLSSNKVNLIILDIMMPKMDGFACLEEIRKTKDIPVIMLSAMKEETDKLNSFNLGVDDYVTKPFSPKELIARVKAHLKRTVNNEEVYTYKDLIVDYRGRKVTINGKSVSLTPKEYELLTYFIKNKGIALSREQLLNSVWDYDYYGDDRTVDTHIKMLRKNLGVYRDLIKTVREVGYKYETEE